MLIRFLGAVLAALLLAMAFPLSLPALPFGTQPLEQLLHLPGYTAAQGYAQLSWLAFIALVPLLEIARTSRRPAEAFWFGYLAGALWLVLHLNWLGSFGVLPVVLLSMYFALATAAATWFAHILMQRPNVWKLLFGFPAIWTAIEYLRQFGFWAFPWNLLGYSQVRNLPLLQVADIGGVFLVSFLIVLANTAVFLVLSSLAPLRQRLAAAAIAGGILCACLAYGEWWLWTNPAADGKPTQLQLALIQGGVETLEAWDNKLLVETLRQYVPASEKALRRWQRIKPAAMRQAYVDVGPQREPHLLLVWPESVLPRAVDPKHSEQAPYQILTMMQTDPESALLMGAHGRPHREKLVENGSVLIEAGQPMKWPFSKIRLVPYGETVPFRGILRFLDYPWGDYDLTEGHQVKPLEWMGSKFGLMVCFDNVWNYVPRVQVRNGAQVLVLMTNNSWYQLKSGVRQHCDMDILRAVELRRPLARCSTTGWSHLVDPCGRIEQSTGVAGSGMISGWVKPRRDESLYAVAGDVFAQICVILTLCTLLGWLLNAPSERFL